MSGVDVPKLAAGPSFACFTWPDVIHLAPTNITDDVRKYIAAVAELVAADREYDEADKSEDPGRFDAAVIRRAAALAAFGGSDE